MFKGTISISGSPFEARNKLISLGFTVVGAGRVTQRDEHNYPKVSEFVVSCTEETLDSVDHLFGELIWSMDRSND